MGKPSIIHDRKDGVLRMCIDYRALKQTNVRNLVPLPCIDEVWDELSGARYFQVSTSELDITKFICENQT